MTPEARIAFYLRAITDALASLAAQDADLAHERRVIREAQEAGL